MCCHDVQGLTIPAVDISKRGVADPHCLLKHKCEYRFKLAFGAADDLEYLRRCGLLFERLSQVARSLLLGLKQAHVLNGDYRLIGKGHYQFDVAIRKRIDSAAR